MKQKELEALLSLLKLTYNQERLFENEPGDISDWKKISLEVIYLVSSPESTTTIEYTSLLLGVSIKYIVKWVEKRKGSYKPFIHKRYFNIVENSVNKIKNSVNGYRRESGDVHPILLAEVFLEIHEILKSLFE